MNPMSDIPLWVFEWAGAFLGLAGAALLALNVRASRFGWLLFLLSNGAWITYGIKVGAHGLVVMQIGFTLTSLMGVYRWLVAAKM
ncbi:MAG: hypothetical protein BGP19_04600 [Thiobacillus sp. 0-1251]|nr:MAG: hypothetical protein BGP19_04600 [Thiobacillus sp. 0-1251]